MEATGADNADQADLSRFIASFFWIIPELGNDVEHADGLQPESKAKWEITL